MQIEYDPKEIEKLPKMYFKNREGDTTCSECGTLGGGTLPYIEALEIGIEHAKIENDHHVKIREVRRDF